MVNAYSAEFGRTGGAVMNVASKSGTNKYHGSLWSFLQNNRLNATGFFKPVDNQKPQNNRNQFGFGIRVRIFDYRLTYAKGAYLLHMLRWKLGDADFFAALKNYQADANLSYKFVVASDLIQHFENQSGQDVTLFFNQWYYGAGYPTYHLQWNQNAENNLKLYVEQETSIPQSVAFFSMPIPVQFIGEGKDSIVRFENDMNGQLFSVTLPFKVDSVSFDPDLHLISFDNTIVRVPGFDDVTLSLFPNPSADNINLFFSAAFVPREISIYDLAGREIYSSIIEVNRNLGVYPIKASTVAAGIYLIKVKDDYGEKILKWVKAK